MGYVCLRHICHRHLERKAAQWHATQHPYGEHLTAARKSCKQAPRPDL